MPKFFVHTREGVFTTAARQRVAEALTELGMSCERLADRPAVRQGVWVFFSEYLQDAVFSGGCPADKPLMALVIYALQGGLDGPAKQRMIVEGTRIVGAQAMPEAARVPVYVVINEISEENWGMFGQQVRLADLRSP